MDKRIKQHRAESLKLSAALVVVADLEGLREPTDSRARLRERRRAARARATHGRDPGGPMWEGLSVFWVKKEAWKGKGQEYLHAA